MVVHNPDQQTRDRAIRDRILERLQAELDVLNPAIRKRKGRHTKAVCRLKAHRSMGRCIRELKSGELRIDRAKVREEEKLDGRYLLSCTDPALSAEDIALGYKQLGEVERAFRTLKSTLDLRPIYHRLPDRIRAHVLLCWLALLLVRLAELQTQQTWDRIRDILEPISRIELCGKDQRSFLRSRLSDEQRSIMKSLEISSPPYKQSLRLAA